MLNEASQRRRVEKNTRELKEWEQRYSTLENESRRKGHEDRLKRLSVSTGGNQGYRGTLLHM